MLLRHRFVNMIIQYLRTNGVITTDKLFEPPFTEISGNGLLGVFNQEAAETIVEVIAMVNSMAEAVLCRWSPIDLI